MSLIYASDPAESTAQLQSTVHDLSQNLRKQSHFYLIQYYELDAENKQSELHQSAQYSLSE